jgi:hypothetical protein
MRLHPLDDAFWWPIMYAIPGGLFGVAFDWLLNWNRPDAFMTALSFGALCAWWTWIVLTFFWLGIIWRSYGQTAQVQPVEHITDAEAAADAFDPAWIEIHCTTSNDIHILRNMTVDYETLQRYAMGIITDGKKTVYNDWKLDPVLKDQLTYKTFIDWMVDNHIGYLDYRNTFVVGERGKDLFADVLQPQFTPPSPTDTGYQRKIYIS